MRERAEAHSDEEVDGSQSETCFICGFTANLGTHKCDSQHTVCCHNRRPAAPELVVEFEGPDTPLLTARNGELLHAIEHLGAKILGLEEDEHDRISFDAANFKVRRDRELQRMVSVAVSEVRLKLLPYTFPPMMSRERRLLHLALAPSGLKSASCGDSSRRSVVLYPEGAMPLAGHPTGNPGTGAS